MAGVAAVSVDDDLSAGQAGVAHGTADDEASGGVDEEFRIRGDQVRGNDGLDDGLDHSLAESIDGDVGAVLRGDDDRGHALHAAVLVVFDGDLALAVRAQEVEQAALSGFRQAARQRVGEGDRGGHQFRRLVAGETEHHALVAGARLIGVVVGVVDAHGDVRALRVDRGQNGAAVSVEAAVRVVVPDALDGIADDLLVIDVRVGRDLAHDHDETGRRARLAGDAGHLILPDKSVQNSIGDLVAEFVRMPLCHRFRSEDPVSHVGCTS